MPSGMMLSLRISFTRSAIGWSRPKGPTRFGPRRTWKRPSSRRSSHVRKANTPITRLASTNAFTNVTMKPSGIAALRPGDAPRAQIRPSRRDPNDAGAEPPQDDRRALVLAAVVDDAQPVARLHAQRLGIVVGDLDAGPALEVQGRTVVDRRTGHQVAIADDHGSGLLLRRGGMRLRRRGGRGGPLAQHGALADLRPAEA